MIRPPQITGSGPGTAAAMTQGEMDYSDPLTVGQVCWD
jgi:hypothetical protein